MLNSPHRYSVVFRLKGRARFRSRVAASRRKILEAIGHPRDITLIRGFGNIGDHFIHAGARHLLAHLPYREVTIRAIPDLHGDLVLLMGSGGWCQPFHAQMPQALQAIEDRFERVIVLPSSFDPTEELVRDVLSKTRAKVFARERESYQRIRGLCDADLAVDTAIFSDLCGYRFQGGGTLRAFRVDSEAAGRPLPSDNDDISLSCDNLDSWLWRIARSAEIETDRAHVMIAGALLGKTVAYYPTSYHKVPALAEYCLSGLDVRQGTAF